MSRYYTLNNSDHYDYPEDMEKILSYLNTHGKIRCSNKEIEELYREYCDRTDAAGWIEPSEERIETFAKWLDEN